MKTPSVLFLAHLTAAAQAGPRTSANYTVAADTADGGGRRATCGACTNDASVGGITGISTVAVPAETAKHGYVGQLYDVTGLTLTAATTNVNEGATLQLGAWQALDDSTFLAVPAASVAWSTVSGTTFTMELSRVQPGTRYVFERTTDFAAWTDVFTLDPASVVTPFAQPLPALGTKSFFRVRLEAAP